MLASEIRHLSNRELEEKERDLRGELFNLRFQLATNQLDNQMRVGVVRRDIARVMTVIGERRREAAAAVEAAPESSQEQSAEA